MAPKRLTKFFGGNMTKMPIKGTSPKINWGAMGGVPVSVYEQREIDEEISPIWFPTKIKTFIEGIKNNLSRVFYRGKKLFSFHCGRRRYVFSYIIEELGTSGWRELTVAICPVCGDKKETVKNDLSGAPS